MLWAAARIVGECARVSDCEPGKRQMLGDNGGTKGYQQSVLSVYAPVSVTLASKKARLDTILDLGPGAMLMFDKNCDEPLTLEVGGYPIATGEAVKVGDKFGLRIRSFDKADVFPELR